MTDIREKAALLALLAGLLAVCLLWPGKIISINAGPFPRTLTVESFTSLPTWVTILPGRPSGTGSRWIITVTGADGTPVSMRLLTARAVRFWLPAGGKCRITVHPLVSSPEIGRSILFHSV